MTRHEEREQAFILLFEQTVTGKEMDEIMEDALDARDLMPTNYVMQLSFGTSQHLESIDALVSENIRGWSIKRISRVALTVLRLAVFELKYELDIPVNVTINEAVELAKSYGTQEDASYVNGVLSAIEKYLKNENDKEKPEVLSVTDTLSVDKIIGIDDLSQSTGIKKEKPQDAVIGSLLSAREVALTKTFESGESDQGVMGKEEGTENT